MAKVNFVNNSTIHVVALDGETFTLKPDLPVPKVNHATITQHLSHYFDECFSADKTSMLYWVQMKMMANVGFSFSSAIGDRSKERERIGARIRQLREAKGIEAKQLASMAKIDAANLSRIEKGRYSVGLDILTRISHALGVKVDLV